MNNNGWLKYGFFLGAGIAIGAAGALLLSRNPGAVKKACTTALGHLMDVKDKVGTAVETAKEDMADMAAEARMDLEERKKASTKAKA